MSFPKVYYRVTKGGVHQFYQPGFNISNSCWLTGAWIKIDKDEWERTKEAHNDLYKNIDDKNQHHRGPGTKVEDMTPAQKKAWEYFSGEITVHCYNESDPKYVKHTAVNLQTAGRCPNKKSIEWFNEQWLSKGFKIIKNITSYGKVTNQTDGYLFPEEFIYWNAEPIDVTKLIIAQNTERNFKMAEEIFKNCADDPNDFSLRMVATTILIDIEQEIIRAEWKAYKGDPDFYDDVEDSKKRYETLIGIAKSRLEKSFDIVYADAKKTHNECAATNLKNSKGALFCFVLPEFNDDGTHKPWGPEDVPVSTK